MKLTLRFLLTAAMGLACVWAQKSSTSTGTTTGGTTTGTSTGTTPSSSTSSPPLNSPTSTSTPTVAPIPRPIFLSGIVIVDDGSPLPDNVNIQSVCGSQQKTVAHTSSSGTFGFQWATNTGSVFEDASESTRIPGSNSGSTSGSGSGSSGTSGNMGGSHMMDPLANCDLRADAAGFTSTRVSLYNHSSFDNFDIGSIVLHRLNGEEGRVVSVLSLKAPKDAKKNFDKGTEQARANKLADAAASFHKAVTIYPQYADAWLSLGRIESQTGARDAAQSDFQKAMALDDKLVGPWQELGYLASDLSKWEDAAHYLDQAVRLDPVDSDKAWYFSAMANYNLGRYELAERSVRAELKLDPGNAHGEYLLGMVLIARKDLKGGADVLRRYIAATPNGKEVESAKQQLSRVESQIGQ